MECNRTRYRLGPGQLLMPLNAGDAHGCVREGATPLVYDSLALLDFTRLPPFAGPIVGVDARGHRPHGRPSPAPCK
ncbi:MAG: hypothetical protein ACLTDR_04705 [Adlercreutzia equolifaciens]